MTPSPLDTLRERLRARPRRWLVTGAAGFVGSNLVEFLLGADQHVVGLDDFSTGHRANLDHVRRAVTHAQAGRFVFVEGDVRAIATCREAAAGVDVVFHEAALASVPQSLEDPLTTHDVNATGTLNVFLAAREQRVERVVYASSSAVYGDGEDLPKREASIGRSLSPYALTKRFDELYAELFASAYGERYVGLRYFNVFGRRQDPNGAYAAVIPIWLASMLRGERVRIHGDGSTTRDFCYIDNVVQANVLAATVDLGDATSEVFNVAVGEQTSLLALYAALRDLVRARHPEIAVPPPEHLPFRKGDVLHSCADVTRARERLGYAPTHSTAEGLAAAIGWYEDQAG